MINLRCLLIIALLVFLSGCGGGGGSTDSTGTAGSTPTQPPVTPPTVETRQTKITLQSDAGDTIGLGQSYSYNLSDSNITVTSDHNRLVVQVEGDESWIGIFQVGGAEQTQLSLGMVTNVPKFSDGMDWSSSGLAWSGEGRWCSTSTGWFSIDNVKYNGSQLSEVKVRFERHCNGASPSLHGEITYYADDSTKPPAPVMPAPTTLWQPHQMLRTVLATTLILRVKMVIMSAWAKRGVMISEAPALSYQG
ncbi:hypothetical protein ACO0K2_08530 [Undibacterium sp. MH2W]|uniref:hypothetical protein n=1 Tax=Undibacterium sp. MH2W TaxID=3413044 RepID=UPI003BF0832F